MRKSTAREAHIKQLSITLLRAKHLLDSAIGESLVFLAETVRNTVNCKREYDDDALVCIECGHYGLCSAACPFMWMLGE